jgi:hypothetical protein
MKVVVRMNRSCQDEFTAYLKIFVVSEELDAMVMMESWDSPKSSFGVPVYRTNFWILITASVRGRGAMVVV